MEQGNPWETKNIRLMEIISDLKNNRYSCSVLNTKHFKNFITQYGFLDERDCAICQIVYFENTILLISELTLCPQHIKERIIETCNQINLTQTINLARSGIIGHTAYAFTQWNQNYIFDTLPILPEPERLIPNAQNRFYPQNQHRSARFASTNSVNGSTNYLASFNAGLNSFNYTSRMAEMESCLSSEDIPPYHTFGATVVTSSPQKQNNIPTNNLPFWNHIENNVLSPLVTDNFHFATPSAKETYMQFEKSNAKDSAIRYEVEPPRRMAYTKNFHLEPTNNPSPFTASSSSSISSNGVLSKKPTREKDSRARYLQEKISDLKK